MNKYAGLGSHLQAQGSGRISMTFADIERILGTKLPPSALRHRAWWSNNPENNVATKEWLDAGYVTEDVNLEKQTLVFRRHAAGVAEATALSWGREVTTDGAPEEGPLHHPLFGAFKGKIHIAPGTDLTAPADPDWGKD